MWLHPGAPRAERGHAASSNMKDFRFCELQNRRRQCRSFVQIMTCSPKKEKVFTEIVMVFLVKILGDLKKKRSSPKF